MVTLLILAYNEEKYIVDTILKYVNDFHKIIIVDDKSKDGTLNKCKELSRTQGTMVAVSCGLSS